MEICGIEFNSVNIQNDKIPQLRLFINDLEKHIWIDAPQILPFFTRHEKDHSLKIIDIINRLVSNAGDKFILNEYEWYIILISAFVHDIGLRCDFTRHTAVFDSLKYKVKELGDPVIDINDIDINNKIRNYHHHISVIWLEKALSGDDTLYEIVKHIDEFLINDILKVCLYHSKFCIIPVNQLPTSTYSYINLPKLICLFRLADELDIGKHRCNIDILNNFNIPPENAQHWYINYLSDCHINDMNDIELTIRLCTIDYKMHLTVMNKIIDNFKNKNIDIIEALRSDFKLSITFSHGKSRVYELSSLRTQIDNKVIKGIYMEFERYT